VQALKKNDVPRQQILTVEIDRLYEAKFHADFLKSSRKSMKLPAGHRRTKHWDQRNTIVIGNPPFGQNGKTARQFLTKACEFGDWVCFVMPRSMQGARMCGPTSVNRRLKLMLEEQLHHAFDSTDAKCNWQEWYLLPEGVRAPRPREPKLDTKGLYNFVGPRQHRQLILQRCGAPGSTGKETHNNGTGQGKLFIQTPYKEVVDAFRNLPEHEDAGLTTHQLSLSSYKIHQLLERELLNQYIAKITRTPRAA
jgi:hypothetical protein